MSIHADYTDSWRRMICRRGASEYRSARIYCWQLTPQACERRAGPARQPQTRRPFGPFQKDPPRFLGAVHFHDVHGPQDS